MDQEWPVIFHERDMLVHGQSLNSRGLRVTRN